MAVYERRWRRYTGRLSPASLRLHVIVRYAIKDIFASKLFTIFYFACFLPIIVGIFLVYFSHNVPLLAAFGIADEFLGIWTMDFFAGLFLWQAIPAFLLAVLIGPSLVSPDLSSHGLSLILSRPISRVGYIVGKMGVMFFLISPPTWMGSLLLFGLQSNMAGAGWWSENLRFLTSHLVGHLCWITVISLLSLAVSAIVRHIWAARAALLAILFAMWAFGGLINEVVETTWGSVIDLMGSMVLVVAKIFDPAFSNPFPIWISWLTLLGYVALSLAVLNRKLRAHEVVK